MGSVLTAVSLSTPGLLVKEGLLVSRRDLDPEVSPQQDPNLVSTYENAEYTAPQEEAIVKVLENSEEVSKETIGGDEETINGANLTPQEVNPLYQRVEELLMQKAELEREDEPEAEVESNSVLSKIKDKWMNKNQNDKETDELPGNEQLSDSSINERTSRKETEESQNGKTTPDYFDPELGDGDPMVANENDDCDDDYERTRQGQGNYEDTHVISKADTVLNPEAEDKLPVDSNLIYKDPSEKIPFLKVRLYEAASQLSFDNIDNNTTSPSEWQYESSANMSAPSFILLAAYILLLLWDL